MKVFLTILAMMTLVFVVGCGGEGKSDQKETTEETQVVLHDCEGCCGATQMPMDKLTEIDGKFYCAGCINSAKTGDHTGHDHAKEDHSGHNH
ncbi:MAG: hypothetical protein GY780_05905 [bacterium]|nr:hypothetical protein [bacterium]